MIWFRYLGISIIKWLVIFISSIFFTKYVASMLHGYVLAIPTWVLIFCIAFGCAYWALHTILPTVHRVGYVMFTWMIVTLVLQISYEMYVYDKLIFIFHDYVLTIQYIIEMLAIISAAYLIRQKKFRKVTGEGMVI